MFKFQDLMTISEKKMVKKWDNRKVEKIKKYKTSKNRRDFPFNIPWKGAKPIPFDVYTIPIDELSFNFDNTRINAELEGKLFKRREKPDPKNIKHQVLVQQILLESKWIGHYETNKLTEDLQKRGQLDPVIATPDGVLIDGNRRLAIFKYLQEHEPESKGFTELEACVLPLDSTESDLKELEMRLQMYHQFQVAYGEINIALEFRYLHNDLSWTYERISEITGNQYTETKIEKMIEIIDMIDEYLKLLPPEGTHRKQYATLDKGWESFDNIYRMLKWSEKNSSKDTLLFRKYFGFEIIASEETTYADVRKFYSVLRSYIASEKLEKMSDTLKGKYLGNFLNKNRIEKEIGNLAESYEFLQASKIEPSRVAEQAWKKLDTIKISNISKGDRSLRVILEKMIKKIQRMQEQV